MRFWKNTATLDARVPEILIPSSPEVAEIAVIGSRPINIDDFPNLRGIFKCGVGTDNVPFEEAENRGIAIGLPSAATRRLIFEETANFAAHLILRMLYVDAGDVDSWVKRRRRFLGNRRVLVIGRGNIGTLVKQKISAFAITKTYDITENPTDDLRSLIKEADVVSLHIPLTSQNRGFINAEKLSWLKDGAAIVNTSRGAIVDEDALYHELLNERIRAAFDVFWHEPYEGRLKAFHPNRFLMSPHVASNCDEFENGLAADFCKFAQQFT